MRRYTPLVLLAVIPLILSSCWKKDAETTTPVINTGSTASPYTFEQIQTLFDEQEKRGFNINSGSVGELSTYLQSGQRNIRDILQSLSGSDPATISKRAYLLSYLGDYESSVKEKDDSCKGSNPIESCTKKALILDIKDAIDQDGNSVSAPNFYLDTLALKTESSIVGAEVYPDIVHRLRMEKEGYLDAYMGINTINTDINSVKVSPIMAKADGSIAMDNQLGGTYTVGEGRGAITYTIASDTFVDQDKKVIQGDVNIYLFALGSEDNNLSTFNLDSFSTGGEVLGSSMLTSGMPFITAYKDGKEVDNIKPIAGKGTVGQSIVIMDFAGVPKNQWLTHAELKPYKIPGFWKLDRKTGVWTESRMQIIDTQGGYSFEL